MRYYGGRVGHVDPRGIEGVAVDPAEIGDEGQHPDCSFDDTEDDTGDEGDDESDPGESSDEEDMNVY